MTKVRIRARSRQVAERPFISESELAKLGDGHIGYIRKVTCRQAREQFPGIRNMPRRGMLYVLRGADGTPIAITDTMIAAQNHARDGDLEIAPIH